MKPVPLSRQRLPFTGLLTAAIAGILLASWLGWTWKLALVLSMAVLFLLAGMRRGSPALIATLLAFALLQTWQWSDAPARRLADWFDVHPGTCTVTGVISDEPKLSPSGSASFPMRLERLSEQGKDTPLAIPPVTLLVRWEGALPSYGDTVRAEGRMMRPPPPRNPGSLDYREWLSRHGIFDELLMDPSMPGRILSRGNGNPLKAFSITARRRMEAILGIDLTGQESVLAAIRGITLGVTENVPEGFTDGFRFTGTMHLFSVSGLHVGMLAVIIWFVLRAIRLPRAAAVSVTVPTLFFYVLVTGMKSGSLRSATMASILLLGVVVLRRSPMVNTLCAAAFLQLLIDTNVLFSAGWQFSYTVVLAILLLAPRLEEWIVDFRRPDPFLPGELLTRGEKFCFRVWKSFAGLVSVSAAAWVGSLIPTIIYFHLISFSALGANLLAVPLAFGVLSLGALALLAGTFSAWLAGAFNNANWLVTKVLLLVVQVSALLPGGHWFVGPPGKPWPVMTMPDLAGSSCAVIRDGFSSVMIDAGRKRDAERIILPMLESFGINRIGDLLVTRADAGHLGGILSIVREVGIGSIFLPDDPGRSPVARAVFASPGTRAFPGVAGERRLSPHVSARLLLSEGDFLILRISMEGLRVLWVPKSDDATLACLACLPSDELRSDIIIMPLGGARMESVRALIRRIAPVALVTPAGGIGRNAEPSRDWTGMLADLGITLFRQDQTGAVILDADPGNPRIRSYLPGGPELKLNQASPGTSAPR